MAFPHCQLASVAYQVNQVASAIEGLLDTQTNEMFKAQKEMSKPFIVSFIIAAGSRWWHDMHPQTG